MSVCLGLDIGSTSIKGAILNGNTGKVESVIREPFPEAIPGLPARFFEVDPHQVQIAVKSVLEQLLVRVPDAQAAFFCGQMGGVILVDERGQPLTNYLSWRDQRNLDPHPVGGRVLDEIQRRWSESVLIELGSELKPGSASSLLFWLAENGQLPANAIPATIGDAIVARLCGVTPSMERTQAIGLINLLDGDWHHLGFSQIGIDGLRWPKIVPHSEPIGHYNWGGRRLPCFPVLGDQQCALHGAGLGLGDLSLNISTGSQVSQLSEELDLGPHQTRYHFDNLYLNTVTHLPAGRSLNVLVDLLTELARSQGITLSNPWPYIAQAAAASLGSELECRLSFFSGPMGDEGHIKHILIENMNVGNLFLAAFQDMTANYVRVSERLNSSRKWKRIVLSGGLTQSIPVLRDLIASRFKATLCESLDSEETLTGLLRISESVYG